MAPRGMIVRPFAPEDLVLIKPQEAQQLDIPAAQRLEYGRQFAENGSAFTLWCLDGDPSPIFCGGHLRRHPEYASLWGVFSTRHREARVFLARTVRRYVAQLRERRVDAQVAASNRMACEWARLIGMGEEARLAGAMPDGSAMVIFVKDGLCRPTASLFEDMT